MVLTSFRYLWLSFAEANRDVGAEVQQPKWRRRLVAAGLVGHHDGSMPAGSAHGRTMKSYLEWKRQESSRIDMASVWL